MTEKNAPAERRFELARGIRIRKSPYDMTREELIDQLYETAEYAARRLIEAQSLRNVLKSAISK